MEMKASTGVLAVNDAVIRSILTANCDCFTLKIDVVIAGARMVSVGNNNNISVIRI
ncbi:unnamed protein product, partial [marine sediment metagenome]